MVDLSKLPRERREQYDEWPPERQRANGKAFIPAPRVGLAFMVVNKCGSTSSTRYIRDFHKEHAVNHEELLKKWPDLKIVSMWRDPYERALSQYRWGVKVQNPVPEFFPDVNGGFSPWIETLCATPIDSWYDNHVASQMWLNLHPLGRMPDFCLPWDWKRLWNMFRVSRPGEAINVSDKELSAEWTPRAYDIFTEWAAKDIEFWNGLKKVK